MRVPFSYRRAGGWPPALLLSVAAHAAAGLGIAIAPAPARSGVDPGLSGLDVVFTREPLPEPAASPEAAVIALSDASLAQPPAPVDPPVPKPPGPPPDAAPPPSVPEPGAQQDATPAYLSNPAPPYPRLAREQGWEGLVLLKVLVRADGAVGDIRVERGSGHRVLDDAALQTVRRWRFLPARVGPLALSSWVRVPVRFRLIDLAQ
jgi:protein TonB